MIMPAIMILNFQTGLGKQYRPRSGAVWSGSSLFTVPSASFGCIALLPKTEHVCWKEFLPLHFFMYYWDGLAVVWHNVNDCCKTNERYCRVCIITFTFLYPYTCTIYQKINNWKKFLVFCYHLQYRNQTCFNICWAPIELLKPEPER